MINLFYNILQNTLWNTPLEFQSLVHAELTPIMEEARKQTVDGIVANALIRNGVKLERGDALQIFSLSERVKAVNGLVSGELTSLSELLSDHNIPYIIFKGQTINTVYLYKDERMPGDIDFYVAPDYFDEAMKVIAEAWNVEMENEESEQHYHFLHNKVLFEMHYNMIHFNSDETQQYWDELLKKNKPYFVEVNGIQISTLDPTINVLYTFLHLYHHLVELGVGLRQFVDVACLLNHYKAEIDGVALERHLKIMGFDKAFMAIGWILIDKLVMPKNLFPFVLQNSERMYEKKILKIVYEGGNFGKRHVKEGFRSGPRYYVNALFRKMSHYRLFWHLSPEEIKATILKELPKKIHLAFKSK